MKEKSFNQVEFKDYIKNDKGKSLSSFIIDKIDNQHQELNHITKFKDIRIDFKGITHEVLLDFYNIECETISISNYDISDKNPKKLPNIYFKNIKAKAIHVNQCKFNSLQFIEDESNFIAFRINGSSITEVNMNSNLNGQLIIQGSNFVNINIGNYKAITINGGLIFNFCNIDGRVSFKDFIFKGKVLFNFTTFRDNIYFNNSIFKDYTSFYHCEFKKTASFYEAVFEKSPNFFQSIFRESINAVNTNLKFNFKDLQTTINQEYDTCKEDTNPQKVAILINHKNKSLDKFANDFRDSFRILKNTLIKDNNLLDASNFHKYELYCKEIELDSKNPKMLKDKIDKLQLCFYRKLCNHHTDLILNLKWLVITIGLFTILFFASKIIQGKEILNLNHYGIALSASSCIMIVLLCLFDYLKLLGGFAYLNLVATLWLVCYNPKLIFGVVNILGDSCFNSFENIVMVTYTIMMFLVVFSLQKTARKNSIIPH
ncbi:pentapeptide repeat-containing protein [Helicobacter cinaedi]|uniref:Membrane protein n=1 Tax=Helicobacter cinaedi TaxID=213 RepID=A0A377JVE3_9HELI|nr:pentapeptide repeat-containing protein [Helicobacter cinaedi]STP13406.1 membrane protein [Helicobacter cinaedi]